MGLFSRKSSKDSSAISLRTSALDLSPSPSHSSIRSPRTPATATASSAPAPPNLAKIPLPRAPDPTLDPAGYLRSISAVRDRTAFIAARARRNDLLHFDVDMAKFGDTVNFVVAIIKVGVSPVSSWNPGH